MKKTFLLSLFIIIALTFAFTSSSTFSLAETTTTLNTDDNHDNEKETKESNHDNENNEIISSETKTATDHQDNRSEKEGEIEENKEDNPDAEEISEEKDPETKEILNEASTEIRNQTPNSSFSKEKQQRILNLAANISNRQEAVIKRHQQILSRLESRQEKLAEQNFNTKNNETALKQIKQDLENTKNRLKDIDNLVFEMVSAPNPRDNWLKIKTLFQTTATEITKNQANLKNSLLLLKNPSLNQPETNEEETENNQTNEDNL